MILAASLVLLAFAAVTAIALQQAFERRSEQALHDRLQGMIYALLGAAELNDRGQLILAIDDLPESGLKQLDSGLYAWVTSVTGDVVWSSPSLMHDPVVIPVRGPGEWNFTHDPIAGLYIMALGVNWIGDDGRARRFDITVADDARRLETEQTRFMQAIWLWLLLGAAILISIQLLVLRWGLSPLRRLTRELKQLESGEGEQIEGRFPTELTPLKDGLNSMLRHERMQQQRYRHALGDLAHSLKTPLAVLNAELDEQSDGSDRQQRTREQLERMQQIVDYQLARAATAGSSGLTRPVRLAPLAEKLIRALEKVYLDKNLNFKAHIPKKLRVRMDQGDLTEMLGNVLDNAGKWSQQQVLFSASLKGGQVCFVIEDDGPGFPEDTEAVMRRGVRADSLTEGQGLGLSLVNDIVTGYSGQISIGQSRFGGGQVTITIPQ